MRVARAVVVLALAGCAQQPRHACGPGDTALIQDALYFGLARPGGVVSADEFARFIDSVVTPRFPEGLTTSAAQGQWRSADGIVLKEGSQVLTLVHPDDKASDDAVRDIADAYKRQFQQEAVMRVRMPACVSF